ncbi:hypothetical protein AOLI_G00036260 [Acnodon oligacanthus]
MASPNSSHALDFATATVAAAAFFACRYLSAELGVLWAIQSPKASFFSLTASLVSTRGFLGYRPNRHPQAFGQRWWAYMVSPLCLFRLSPAGLRGLPGHYALARRHYP